MDEMVVYTLKVEVSDDPSSDEKENGDTGNVDGVGLDSGDSDIEIILTPSKTPAVTKVKTEPGSHAHSAVRWCNADKVSELLNSLTDELGPGAAQHHQEDCMEGRNAQLQLLSTMLAKCDDHHEVQMLCHQVDDLQNDLFQTRLEFQQVKNQLQLECMQMQMNGQAVNGFAGMNMGQWHADGEDVDDLAQYGIM